MAQVQRLYVDLHKGVVNGVAVYKILRMLKNKRNKYSILSANNFTYQKIVVELNIFAEQKLNSNRVKKLELRQVYSYLLQYVLIMPKI